MNTETVATTVNIPDDVSSLQPPRAQTSFDDLITNHVVAVTYLSEDEMPPEFGTLMDFMLEVNTADEIADLMRQYGAKGSRGILETCPLSNFAAACVPEGDIFQTDVRGININSPKWGGWLRLNATPAMREFVKNFDSGLYPDLVE